MCYVKILKYFLLTYPLFFVFSISKNNYFKLFVYFTIMYLFANTLNIYEYKNTLKNKMTK